MPATTSSPCAFDEELAVELVVAGGGVAREGDAGAGVLAHVAEDHGLHGDGGAPVGGDGVELPVGDGAVVLPGAEDGADGLEQLVRRVVGELHALAAPDLRLELADERAQRLDRQLGVVPHAHGVLLRLEDHLEGIAVLLALGLQAEDHVAEHRDEAAVAVPREARVPGPLGEPLDGGVVEPEVQDRVHHPGHRDARAGADRDEQRVRRVAEALPGERLDLAERGAQLAVERAGQLLPRAVVLGADLGGDR